MRKIIIEEYNQKWKLEFEKAKKFYSKLFNKYNIHDVLIEHVGSTSVEGMWAKPILDIDIIVPDTKISKNIIRILESVGYIHKGDLGIQGREVLEYKKDNKNINWMDHHLYVCINGCENLKNHLLLKKHLKENRHAVEVYSALKRKLAIEHEYDIESYIAGKTELITRFLRKEGMNIDEILNIISINNKI